MDTTIIVAIIGAGATIIAALIGLLIKRKQGARNKFPPRTQFGNITAGRDAVVAGRDAVFVQQQFLEERFISKQGARLVSEVSKSIISDEHLRFEWSSFDAKFLYHCIKDTPRGMVFDGEAFQAFRKPENDQMFGVGVEVYAECCKRIGNQSDKDYIAFNKIAQIYLSARMVLRQG